MNQAYRFGIEEEYFLADAKSGGTPTGAIADRFHAAASHAIGPVSHELLKGQVETCTKPETEPHEAFRTLKALRRDLSSIAAEHGLSLFAAGSHPLGKAREQLTTESERYQKLKSEFGIIATRSMVCATHIHVEVPDPAARIDLMNRLMPFLPLLLALSVSSPFWQGRESGLKGFRLAAFSEWPRMGLPEIFSDEAEYKRFVHLLVATKAIQDASFIWWLIRPSTHFPTLELRICDSCTDVTHAVAIAALYRCLVRAVVRRPDLNRTVGPIHRGICAENIWHAQRDGMEAGFIDLETGGLRKATEMLDDVLALVEEDADALKCPDWVQATRDVARRGTSAERQLAAFRAAHRAPSPHEALRSVVQMLATKTIESCSMPKG